MTYQEILSVSLSLNVFLIALNAFLGAALVAVFFWPQRVVQFQAFIPKLLRRVIPDE